MADNGAQLGSYVYDYRIEQWVWVHYHSHGGTIGTARGAHGDVNPGTNSGPTAPKSQSGPQGEPKQYDNGSGSSNGGSPKSS